MVEPLRHRQTKEADNRYVRPTATAPHLDSTKLRRTQPEQLFSDLPPKADLTADIVDVAEVPEGDYSHRSKQPHYSTTASARAINVR